jgi:hypothetical protein
MMVPVSKAEKQMVIDIMRHKHSGTIAATVRQIIAEYHQLHIQKPVASSTAAPTAN